MTPIEHAMEAARIGAKILLGYWENLGKEDATFKARNDWVSAADRESEAAILAYLAAQFPDDAFLGEESGSSRAGGKAPGEAKRTWIVDPLDGTSNYLQHFPVWSISIALRDGDEMIAGLVHDPLRDQWFTAERGAGAFRDGVRMTVSDQPGIEGSFLATGFPFRAQKHVSTYCRIFEDVVTVSKGVRRAGSAALDLAYTAAGVFDGFFEMHLAPWDIAAGALLITESGGLVSDFSGGSRYWERGNIVGANRAVHRDILALIGRHTAEDQLQR